MLAQNKEPLYDMVPVDKFTVVKVWRDPQKYRVRCVHYHSAFMYNSRQDAPDVQLRCAHCGSRMTVLR